MIGPFWIALDWVCHRIPLRRFSLIRYSICLRADRYMEEQAFDVDFAAGEPVEVRTPPGGPRLVVTESTWSVVTEPQTWANNSTSITYRAP